MMPCPLDPTVVVILIEPETLGVERFRGSHAFAVYGPDVERPFIVIDKRITRESWYTQDHLLVIMAHELAHIKYGENEELADLAGMQLLEAAGYTSAFALHLTEYERRKAKGHYAEAA